MAAYENMDKAILKFLKRFPESKTDEIRRYLKQDYYSVPRSTLWGHLVKLLNEKKIKRRITLDHTLALWSLIEYGCASHSNFKRIDVLDKLNDKIETYFKQHPELLTCTTITLAMVQAWILELQEQQDCEK